MVECFHLAGNDWTVRFSIFVEIKRLQSFLEMVLDYFDFGFDPIPYLEYVENH